MRFPWSSSCTDSGFTPGNVEWNLYLLTFGTYKAKLWRCYSGKAILRKIWIGKFNRITLVDCVYQLFSLWICSPGPYTNIFSHKIMEYWISCTTKLGALVMNKAGSLDSVIHNETKSVHTRAWAVFNKFWPKHYFQRVLIFDINFNFWGFSWILEQKRSPICTFELEILLLALNHCNIWLVTGHEFVNIKMLYRSASACNELTSPTGAYLVKYIVR